MIKKGVTWGWEGSKWWGKMAASFMDGPKEAFLSRPWQATQLRSESELSWLKAMQRNIIQNGVNAFLKSYVFASFQTANSFQEGNTVCLFVCFKGRIGYRCFPRFPLGLTNRIHICRVPQKVVSSLHTAGVYEKPGPRESCNAIFSVFKIGYRV